MKIDDLFTPTDSHTVVDSVRDSMSEQPGVSKYEEILTHPLMSRHERFDDWEQECIDAGYKHMFSMRIGSARSNLYVEACKDMVFHHYIQAFLNIIDMLRSPHSSVFIRGYYGYPYAGIRVRLDPEKYADSIVPETYTMCIYICIRFGKQVSEWFRMMNRLWNAYNNEYNNRYGIGLWEHEVWIYSGNKVGRAQRHFQKCETHSMHNFGENMCHIATTFEKKNQRPFSPSLCECMTKGCQKYMIFDLTPVEVAEKIKRFFLRYGDYTGEDPYDNAHTHSCMYY